MTDTLAREVTAELEAGGRILVSRLQYLGDVILTLPLVDALRRRFPDAEIDYLSRGPGAEVLEGEPSLNAVFRVPGGGDVRGATVKLVRDLRRRKYAASIDLYSNSRSALLTWLSGAKLRVGEARRGRRHLYTHATESPNGVRSAIDFHLHFGRSLGIDTTPVRPSLTITEVESSKAREELTSLGIMDHRPVVGVHPGGKWEVKRWPTASFVQLVERLTRHDGMQVVVFCGQGEETYRDAVEERVGDKATYLPTRPVRQTAAVIGALDGMVVCDGGVMHIAVAVGTPTVGIFGSSEPDIWFPYETFGPYVPAIVPISCRPCHSHFCDHLSCLHRLTVHDVEEKLLDVMRGGLHGDVPDERALKFP